MDITELLQQHRVDYKQAGEHHHVRPGWLGLDCGLCSPGVGSYKCGVNLRSLYASCWTCGYRKLADVLAEVLPLPRAQVERLCATLRDSRGYVADDGPAPRAGKVVLPRGLGPLLPVHRKYLSRRGFDPDEVAQVWGVQGIGLAARLAWRLFLPVHHRGEVVSWTTRALGDEGLRYISAKPDEERLDAHQLLYGEDHVRHTVVVVEGPLDAIRIGPGAVATMGVKYTPAQMLRVTRYPRRVVCFDNEPAAQRRARHLMEDLCAFRGETINCVLTSGKDPASASRRDIRELRRRYLE